MRIALVTNKQARGLSLDAELLSDLIRYLGHEAEVLQYDETHEGGYDLVILLEVVVPGFARLSKAPLWLIPNPEFLHHKDLRALQSVGKILCKTRYGHSLLQKVAGDKAVYTGFLSADKYDPQIRRQLQFLHVAGNSKAKGTEAVIDAWRWKYQGKRIKAPLYVVSEHASDENLPENVQVMRSASDIALRRLQNACLFHLQPSETEGWSHVLHESLSCNALLLTTDAPPMNEITAFWRVQPYASHQFNLSEMHKVSAIDIHAGAQEMLQAPVLIETPRQDFLGGNESFRETFSQLLEEVTKPKRPLQLILPEQQRKPDFLRIAFLGNFEAPESTENMVKWALESAWDNEVIELQENRVTFQELEKCVKECDLFLWVRTPNWLQVSDLLMLELLQSLSRNKIPSVSLHLDKFWGIPAREPEIGRTPFWLTDHVYTADGSRDEDFRRRGVNHRWMRPAVSDVYVHPGTPRKEYLCDVGFVGARGYHQEYPFREELLAFLEQTYGERFKHINNLRGHGLNDFYASCKVVVGDCIFAGLPRYWSDRVPETIGRYGFLLHPAVEGLDVPTALYHAQDTRSLKQQIDYFLANESARLGIKREATRHVVQRDTWTMRMGTILGEVVWGKVS